MPLTDPSIRNATPKGNPYKLHDKDGLYVLVNRAGKYFRFDYRYAGKRKTLALGVYPKLSLKDARGKLQDARKLLEDGIDPAQQKKLNKIMNHEKAANNFKAVAEEWFSKNKHTWTEGHARTIKGRMELNLYPWLSHEPIASITAPQLLAILRRIESRGALDTARRVKQICSQVFRYAIATGRAERDPSADLRGALSPPRSKRMATITDPNKIGGLLRAIEGYDGQLVTKCALRLAPLTFVRPGELRQAEWQEINFETREWKIPAEKMKMRQPHIIPLSSQAIAILKEIEQLTGQGGRYVFPSLRSSSRPMSNNTILAALRRMGYSKEEMTGHGFRAMASTILHEQGWKSEVIERQLAHREKNTIRAAYNHAQYLHERKRMMQAWANYLDGLKAGGNVISINAKPVN